MSGEFEVDSVSLFTDATGQIKLIPVSSPPGSGAGVAAPIGSMALSTEGLVYQKIGAADTDWTSGGTLGDTTSFWAFNNTPRVSQSTSYFTFLTIVADIPVAGQYKLAYSYVWSSNSVSDNFQMRVLDQSDNLITANVMEAADSTGSGIVADRIDSGGTLNTGTDQRTPATGFIIQDLPLGVVTYRFQVSGAATNKRMAVYNVAMSLEKI